jgi:hypothetical protein
MGQSISSLSLCFGACALIVQKIRSHFLVKFSYTSPKTRNRPAFAVIAPETLACQAFSAFRQLIIVNFDF